MKIIKKNLDSRNTRHIRLLVMLSVLAIMLTTAITTVSAHLYTVKAREMRINTAQGTARLAAASINSDEIENWLNIGDNEEYERTRLVLEKIYDNSPGLEKLFVFEPTPTNTYVIFDIDGTGKTELPLGRNFKISENMKNMITDMIAGEEIGPIEVRSSSVWMIYIYQTVFDSNDKCVAYVRADISMLDIKEYVSYFTLRVMLIASFFMILCIFFGVRMSIDYHKADDMEVFKEREKRDKLLIREIVESFAMVIDMKDAYTNGHSTRVAKYTAMLTRELGYDQDTIEKYYSIALMHDIGKIGIPDEVLNKPGKLTPEEYAIIKSHTERGYEVLKNISIMPEIAIGARAHHERPDGKGYPLGLKGNAIPRVAQIIAVADTFDAMYSDRPYRKRMDFDKVVSIIKEVSGTQLTEDVVDAFLRLVEKDKFRSSNDRIIQNINNIINIDDIENTSGSDDKK